jgi:hypothetical protein
VSITVDGARLTDAHRRAQSRLAAQVAAQVAAGWRLLDPEDLDRTVDGWLRVMVPLVTAQASVSARLAARYLEAFRQAEIGVGGFSPVVASPPPPAAITTSLTVVGPVAVKQAMVRAVPLARAVQVAMAAVAGEAVRHTLAGGRSTVLESVAADRRAQGWARAPSGSPCAFCAMLASRGPVYREESADFEAHGGCQCTAEPVYDQDRYSWPSGASEFRRQWDEVTAGLGGDDAVNAFRRSMVDAGTGDG